MSQREILRAARRAQAKLANREKPRAKRQPCAKRGTNLRVSSGVRGEFSRSSLRQFCSYNAVGDGVMSKNRKKKRNVESYNAKPRNYSEFYWSIGEESKGRNREVIFLNVKL